MKKITVVSLILMLLLVSACGGKKSEDNNDKKEEKKAEIVENGVYDAPKNPTQYQISIFNKLGEVLTQQDNKAIAEYVAINFSADFFSLLNKEGSDDVGGVTYIPKTKQEDFKIFASNYVYANFVPLKDKYGKDELPSVKKVEVTETTTGSVPFTTIIPADEVNGIPEQEETNEYEAFIVHVSITYDDTKISLDELKQTAVYYIANVEDRYVIVKMD